MMAYGVAFFVLCVLFLLGIISGLRFLERHRHRASNAARAAFTDDTRPRVYSVQEVIENAPALLGQEVTISGILLVAWGRIISEDPLVGVFDGFLVDETKDARSRGEPIYGPTTVPRPFLYINNDYFGETMHLSDGFINAPLGINNWACNFPFTLTATLSNLSAPVTLAKIANAKTAAKTSGEWSIMAGMNWKGVKFCLTSPTIGVMPAGLIPLDMMPSSSATEETDFTLRFMDDQQTLQLNCSKQERAEQDIWNAIPFARFGGCGGTGVVLCPDCLAEIVFEGLDALDESDPDKRVPVSMRCPNDLAHCNINYVYQKSDMPILRNRD